MTRIPCLAVPLLALAALAAHAAELKLEERKFDVVTVRGEPKPLEGTIKTMDDNHVQFITVKGIGYTWPRSAVTDIRPKCSLQESYLLATRAAGNDPTAHYRLHELCLAAKLDAEAEVELRKAIEVDPKYLPAYDKLLEMARAMKNLDRELGALEAADRNGIASSAMQIRRAEICVRLGLIDAAEPPLKKVLAAEPFHPQAESRLAMLELLRGKTARAEILIQAMIRRAPDSPEALTALGELEFARGNLDKAAEALEKAAATAKSPVPAAALGAIDLRRNKTDDAAKHYEQALALDPAFPPALAGQGLVLAAQGKLKEAADSLDKALAAEPKRADFIAARAYVAELAAETDNALKLYLSALELDPPNVWAMTGAARCHWQKGDHDKARSAFLQALALRPDFAPARRGLGRIELGRNSSEAADSLRKLAESGQATPDDRAAFAGALIRLQRFGEAAAELAKAGSDNVHARIGLGFLAYAEGKTDDATAHFDAAAKLGDYKAYADAAIQRIRLTESRVAWSDIFADRPENDADVRNGWKEIEPPGFAISITDKRLLIDGKAAPNSDVRLVQLSRGEKEDFVSVAADAETGSETESFTGVFVAPRGGKPVLFGRSGSGEAALLAPDQPDVKNLGAKIAQGKFTIALEINRAKGTVRPLLDDRRISGFGDLPVPALAKTDAYDVGLFTLPDKDKPANCIFHAVRIVRTK